MGHSAMSGGVIKVLVTTQPLLRSDSCENAQSVEVLTFAPNRSELTSVIRSDLYALVLSS